MTQRPSDPGDEHTTALVAFSVRGLFGRYDYDLQFAASAFARDLSNRLVVLYGENGTGKTTILGLIYHLLAGEPYRGHFTAVGQVRFRAVRLFFLGGEQLLVNRPESADKGPYRLTFEDGRGVSLSYQWVPRERGVTPEEQAEDLPYKAICGAVRDLVGPVRFLQADRRVRHHEGMRKHPQRGARVGEYATEWIAHHEWIAQQERSPLDAALAEAHSWIRTRALRAQSRGFASANDIYAQVLKHIAPRDPEQTDTSSIKTRLRSLAERNADFSQYGLLQEMSFEALERQAFGALDAPDTRQLAVQVLSPYLDGVEARFAALDDVRDAVSQLLTHANLFLKDKALRYDLRTGFQVETPEGDQLESRWLSSGETHLILMFCSVLAARGRAGLILIDEPEISLNAVWQRRLIEALLMLMDPSSGLIVATHSIELLAQYRERMVELDA